ncbi:cupin domain-containing protein [Streptomyces phyllanthi]|uniref:Cupin domain-containing protein n=1 Tax=Streptomyces phyllanthi TaxID=1803180 RepID=A0A5N8VWG5_9ACTN|nr:cupin domain-containing protein [Streptomyces phyllanthi]MPY38404.1 cupin domain-containing protein [Streptomyces phyllanthi]
MAHKTHLSSVGEGLELDSPDARIIVKVDAEHTDGTYELFEVDAPRGPTVPPHGTPWAKTYYVLHGRMTVFVDGELHDLGPGASITIPPNALHTFTVHTPSVRFLAISLTDAMGRFFRDIDRTVPAGTPLEEAFPLLQEVVGRHGIRLSEQLP